MTIHFWPTPQSSKLFLSSSPSLDLVENFFTKLYNPYRAVLFSSARIAIEGILNLEGLSRNNVVGVPRFSSACVLESVSRVTIPESLSENSHDGVILYHQMGIPYSYQGKVVIEDSVDSLCESVEGLFPNSSSFEIFSLPKILGCPHGGLVVARNHKDADDLTKWRDENSHGSVCNDFLRMYKNSSSYLKQLWERTNRLSARPSALASAMIFSRLKDWEGIATFRKNRLQEACERFPNLWRLHPARLPVALPIPLEVLKERSILRNPQLIRHFYIDQKLQSFEMRKFFALPLHHDLSKGTWEDLINER